LAAPGVNVAQLVEPPVALPGVGNDRGAGLVMIGDEGVERSGGRIGKGHRLAPANPFRLSNLHRNAGEDLLAPGRPAAQPRLLTTNVRLIPLHCPGQSVPAGPWAHDRATHGFPAKHSFCAAENEEASPWQPLHIDRGYGANDDVAVMGIQAFHNMVEFISTGAAEILDAIAANMTAPGTNNVSYGGEPAFVIAPEHAALIADRDFSKEDAHRCVFERARVDLNEAPGPVQEMV
jgi:hypothetical protein